MCRTAETVFSRPKVLCSHCILSLHHSSIRPSCCIFIISSCVPDIMTRIALTWSGVIFRLMPADLMRCAIASSRTVTPSGSSTSSRLRCVRVESTFGAITLRSIWSDIRASDAPFAFLKSRVKYPILNTVFSLDNSVCLAHSPHGSRGFKRGIAPLLDRVFLAVLALREENALLSYGFSLLKSLWEACGNYILNPLLLFLAGCCSCLSACLTVCNCLVCCVKSADCTNRFPHK